MKLPIRFPPTQAFHYAFSLLVRTKYPDIIRFNQAFFDSYFLSLRLLLPLRETSFVLRIYPPNRGKGRRERRVFLLKDNFVRMLTDIFSKIMKSKKQKIVYVDMDNVLVDFRYGISRLSEEDKIKYDGDYDECPGIFNLMRPMPEAIESYHLIARHFDTYILSTSPWENPSAWSDKIKWVQKYLGSDSGKPAYKRLILSHHKNLNMGDFLIDDRTANGADKFAGEHIHFGTDKFPDWKSVTDYLMKSV
jgi:5'(3')-deoxyribonucleotidase